MSADDVAALAAAAVSGAAALVALVVVIVLSRRIRDLREMIRDLRSETVPLVRDARVVVDQAATEMLRVGDVLSSADAVAGTVDSASRLAYRAFANPVVKVLAFRTGVTSTLRRLFSTRSRDVAWRSSSSAGDLVPAKRTAAQVRTVHRRPRARAGR
jgi:hypothetical protein